MEKIPVIIAARMGSSRLPGKSLKLFLDGRSMLDVIIERIRSSQVTGEIVIATSTNQEDDKLEQFAINNNVSCYRGSHENVALRIHQAATNYKFDYFFEVLGDNPLIDPDFFDQLFHLHNKTNLKYASFNTREYNFNKMTEYPVGVRVQLLKSSEMANIVHLNDPYFNEHATAYFYNKIDQSKYILIELENSDLNTDKNLAVNTFKDFCKVGIVLSEASTTAWEESLLLFNQIENRNEKDTI